LSRSGASNKLRTVTESRIFDVGDQDFEREVLERSRSTPVLVDFWAPWCGPCRVLGPLLERLAQEQRGAFALARVDVDQSPALAQAFQIRSIPAVKAFRDGALVAEFEGAQPESVLRRFVASLLPSEADLAAQAGEQLAAAGDAVGAEERFRAALALDPRHPVASLGLGRLHAERGETQPALEWLDRIGPGTRSSDEAARLSASLRTGQAGEGDEDELRRRVEADPADVAARLELGRLLAARGQHEAALEALLEAVRRDPHHADDAARRAMLDLFSILGPEHPLTVRYRPALARVLFR
jgi:putative thioredoxin